MNMFKRVMVLSALLMSANCTNLKAMNNKVVIGSLLTGALIPFIHDRIPHPEAISCDIISNILIPLPLTYLVGRELQKGHENNSPIVFSVAFCAIQGAIAIFRYFPSFYKKHSRDQ